MKKTVISILIISIMMLGAKVMWAANTKMAAFVKKAPVAIACMQNGDLSLLVLSPVPKQLDGQEAECVMLVGPTHPITELKSYRDGSCILFGRPANGTAWTKFGCSDYQKMLFKGKTAGLNSFPQVG
jgi:hypothetical protein